MVVLNAILMGLVTELTFQFGEVFMATISDILKDDTTIAPSGEMMTEPKSLSECGPVLVIDGTADGQYQIEIEPGEFMVIRAGVTVDSRMSTFKHPNVVASRVIHEFKHYRKGGGKFWTARAGIDFFFVIPRSAIKMLPEKAYSYIPAEINGVKVAFNVTGGTRNGWTDWLNTRTSIGVNHGIRDLRRLAEVAINPSPFDITPKAMDAEQEATWKRLAARTSKTIISQIVQMADNGKAPIIKMMPGYAEEEGTLVKVIRRWRKENLDPTPEGNQRWRYVDDGAVKQLVVSVGNWGSKVRAKMAQVDWNATAIVNGLAGVA